MSNQKETKLCRHCKTEIPAGAKVCPNCRKKQKGGIVKWILIAVVVLAVVGSAAYGGSGSDKPSDSNPKKVGSDSGGEDKKDTEAGDEGREAGDEGREDEDFEQKSEFEAGDVIEASDLKISFISAGKFKSDNEFIQPKDGHVYYKMDFEFENISDSDQHVSSFDFTCYADGYDMERSYVMDGMDLDATLSPGKKTKGSVFFEVPKKSKEIILEYETNFWTEDKIVFRVK